MMKRIFSLFLALVMMMSFSGICASAANVGLSKNSVTVSVGKKTAISLKGALGTITWGTTDSSVCKYSKGYIYGIGKGTAYIYAKNKGKIYKCKVTVKGNSGGSIKLSKSSVTVGKGEKTTVSVSCSGLSGRVKVMNDASSVCSTSVSAVVNGKFAITLKGKSTGNATIKVYDSGNKNVAATIKIRVVPASVSESNDDSVFYVSDDGYTIYVFGGTDDYYGGNFYGDPADEMPEPEISVSEFIDEVIRLVNEERTSRGLNALTKNDELCDNAKLRADEVGRKFSHTRPNGQSCFTAVTVPASYMGENIAMGQRSPSEVVEDWMNSAGHKENILSKDFVQIGVGFDPETFAWVQIFIG